MRQPGLQLAGSLPQAAAVAGDLDTVLSIATGLLGVAALIALVGVAAGIAFGSLGAAAVTRETALGDLHLAVPLTSAVVVVALSLLAGAVASVLPARRAALASPSAALAA